MMTTIDCRTCAFHFGACLFGVVDGAGVHLDQLPKADAQGA
jgi:hypothetical protein